MTEDDKSASFSDDMAYNLKFLMGQIGPKDVTDRATSEAKYCVRMQYPYVWRTRNEIEEFANLSVQGYIIGGWGTNLDENKQMLYKSLFVQDFISEYFREVERRDEEEIKAGREIEVHPKYLHYTKLTDDRSRIIDGGVKKGKEEAEKFYPFVKRSPEEVEEYAGGKIKKYLASEITLFTDDKEEYERLYIEGYVPAYLNKVAELDKKAGIEPQATVSQSNTATLQGATITLIRVEHKADECIYYLEVADPAYFDEPYEQEWVLQLEGATVPDTTPSASASFGIAAGPVIRTSSSSVPPQSASKTSQKSRKVIGSSFSRKPQ